jgi:hypothetical protein
MSLILNGTDGLSDVDGTAGTPAIRGTDANTGIFFPAADTIAFSEGGAEAMRIDSDGDVGIGTTSPAFRLDVRDGSGSTRTQITNTANAAAGAGLFLSVLSSGTQVSNSTIAINNTGDLRFFTGTSSDAERMRITSAGDILMTPGSNTTARGKVDIAGTGGTVSPSVPMAVSRAGDAGIMINFYSTNSGTTSIGNITNAGGTNTQYNTSSDYRLKENVAPMVGSLAKVQLLKPCTYKWKSTGAAGQGFIAHELQEVVPDAVSGEKDAVDSEGGIVAQGIDTSYLVATLTSAIQELKAELDSIKAELATLKAQP